MKRTLLALAGLLLLNPFARAADPAGCTYVEVASLPVRYVGTGLAPAVDGTIDGSPATMLVDTGAFETQLTMNGVVRRDLGLHMTGRHAEGFGGSSRLYSARLNQFAIGPIASTRSMNMLVIGDAMITPAFDAIVGAPFLLQADMEFDLRAKRTRFFRPLNCGNTALAIWKEETIVVPFESAFDKSPNPHFTVKVNGRELDAIIDTGAHHTIMSRYGAKRAGIDVDGPGVKRVGYMVGIGTERAPTWSAPVTTVQIGDETIKDVELGIIESQGNTGPELFLGQDFLRAHRVLFAMSQRKLYIAYLGGDIFERGGGAIEPWMREEAEQGNADAQYVLANAYNNGRGLARDPALAQSWLEKAAAARQPHANLALGRQLLLAGRPADAIPKLRIAMDQLPAERLGALWLYNARVRNGEAELAKTELEAKVKRQRGDDWPAPIADFYLGKLDAAGLLDQAGRDRKLAQSRSCQANSYMAEWHDARGEQAQAEALKATLRAQCMAPKPAAPVATAPAP